MRIGIDCRYLREAPRGVGHYLLNILNRFNCVDDTFFLYSPGPIIFQPKKDNFIIRQGRSMPGTLWFEIKGRNLINSDRLDSFWSPCDIMPSRLSKNIYQVLSIHDLTHIFYPQTMANYNRLIHRIFFTSSMRNANHIITMSEHTKKSIVEHFNIVPTKISVIYEGVDEKFKPLDKMEAKKILQRYSIERPYLLSVGTLEPKKNYTRLLKAYNAVKTDLDLIIVGKKGWKADDIFKTIASLGIKERVKILGYVQNDDLPYLYNGAEVFVFPSLYEGFGLPLLEAMACGTPVICSNTSSLAEISGDAAIKFNPESVDEIVNQLQRVIDDNDLKRRLTKLGLARAKEFSWDKTAKQTLAILKR